jgi:hypothetical protein
MNRRNFFELLTAAIGWMTLGKVKYTGNCFVTYHSNTIDFSSKPSGRFSTRKAALNSNPTALIEYGPEAWTTDDLSTIGALCITVPARRPTETFLVESPSVNSADFVSPKTTFTKLWLGERKREPVVRWAEGVVRDAH